MKRIRQLTVIAGTATALILALSGFPSVVQATERTTGQQFGKLAAMAEMCGYRSRAKQIQSKYSFLPDFNDSYTYWRNYWGKYDIVRGPCGQIKGLADQLISLDVPNLGDQQSKSVDQVSPEHIDGRWVIEIADASDESRNDTRIIEIKDRRFSVEVSFYGWRGAVTGQIDDSGDLTGKVNLKKIGYGRRIDPFEGSYRDGEFHAKTTSKSRSGGVYKGAAAFLIDLTRATASSEAECVSTACEDKDEQAANLSQDIHAAQKTPIEPDAIAVLTTPTDTAEGKHPFDGTWKGKAVIMNWLCRQGPSRFDLTLNVENGVIHGGDRDGVYSAEGQVSIDGRLKNASLNGYILMEGPLAEGIFRLANRDCGARYALKKITAQRLTTETNSLAQDRSIQTSESQVIQVPEEKQVAALSETADGIDGKWVLEIREPNYIPEASKVTVEIVDGRFTANVSKNGWRGEVSGEIDHSGKLVAWGYLRSLTNAEKALLKWSVEPSGSTYDATIPASTNWLSMTFEVSLYR